MSGQALESTTVSTPWTRIRSNPTVVAVLGTMTILGLAASGPVGGWLAWTLLVILATRGYRQAVQAFALAYLLTMSNPNVFHAAEQATFTRWLVLLVAWASVHGRWLFERRIVPPLWWATVAWTVGVASAAWFVSALPVLSTFKVTSWWMAVSMLVLAFEGASRRGDGDWNGWFTGYFATVVVLGLPLYPLREGYLHALSGFMGLFNHPQAYTVFLAMFLAWWAVRTLGHREALASRTVILGVTAFSTYATFGRTGLAAAVVAIPGAYLWWVVRERRTSSPQLGRSGRVALSVAAISVATLLAFQSDAVEDGVRDFLVKRGGSQIVESLLRSRGALVERAWQNVVDDPLMGIGFGVPSDLSLARIQREPLLGLPIGAATEKGFALLALLEETGVVGFLAFTALFAAVVRPLLRRGVAAERVAVALAAFGVNFGEAVLFAVGGTGGLVWILLLWARTGALDDVKERR